MAWRRMENNQLDRARLNTRANNKKIIERGEHHARGTQPPPATVVCSKDRPADPQGQTETRRERVDVSESRLRT